MKISAIVATYCEESTIGGLLEDLRAAGADEIIVADGDSPDRTREIARAFGQVVTAPRGRGTQMNAGAYAANGDVLLFLHADVRLGPRALGAIRAAMMDARVAGGNLDIRFDGGDLAAAVFTRFTRWRRRVLGLFYGDSGIFCRRAVFEQLGGYRPWPVMEDYEFARRLGREGKLALLDEPIHVSGRRWRRAGLVPTLWAWFWIQALYSAGVPPQRLARWYRDIR
jgi:rSAM/selenodomain-associated transferase 2